MIRHLLITLPGTSKLGFEPPILRFNLCKKITSLPNAIKYAQRDLKPGRCHIQILCLNSVLRLDVANGVDSVNLLE